LVNSQATPQARTAPVITVVVVLGSDTSGLPDILRHSNWNIQTVADFDEAAVCLQASAPCVVVAPYESSTSDGWPKLLDFLQRSGSPSRLILTDRLTDELMWADALSLGAHDVLAQPFDPTEIFRVITAAWNESCYDMVRSGKSCMQHHGS
jgi:DNA-binding response OmpR family regulator